MIIVELNGGLGNQMFQYAFARSIQLDTDSELFFNLNQFENKANNHHSIRRFELDSFNLKINTFTEAHRIFFPKSIFKRFFLKVYKFLNIKSIIFENSTKHDESILKKIKHQTYLIGHWQSPKYFNKYKSILVQEFQFLLKFNRDLELENHIMNSNSVSIHIRRGDYVSNNEANIVHGICTLEYYKSATDLLNIKYNNICWYIFSDDINWCRTNFTWLQNIVFVAPNLLPSHYDMYLMSLCNHNVIANSTFSWWAAWLNRNENKTVIAPKKWYVDLQLNSQTSDLIPTEWIRL